MLRHLAIPALAHLALSVGGRADVRLPAVIDDGMVLQRETSVALWGWAAPGETVRVEPSWKCPPASATADAKGSWRVNVPTPAAGGPFTVAIHAKNEIVVHDVMIGEVWLASGQSNMEMPVADFGGGYRGAAHWQDELKTADIPDIRWFDVANDVSSAPLSDCKGQWKHCTPETARNFSATAFFFARELHAELGVPIGILEADWGGTPIEAWTSRESLRGMPAFNRDLSLARRESERAGASATEHAQALADWRARIDEADNGARAWMSPVFDDSRWPTIDTPSTWTGDLGAFDGLAWMRRAIDLPASWTGREALLELGPIDDMDATWVNGTKVGETMDVGRWQDPRRYAIAAGVLKSGRNVIAVRVLDTGGLGGINGKPEELALKRTSDKASIPLAGAWRLQASTPRSKLPAYPAGSEISAQTATALYNGMIAPLVPFGVRGAIWYQGEANVSRAHQYRHLLPTLIADWRARFEQADFPFYFVQIAPFAYETDRGEAAELREAQSMALSVPHTGMAVTMDIGNPTDIHPNTKQEIGHRLALCALAGTYEHKVACAGPTYRAMKIEGDAVRLYFGHAAGLTSHGASVAHVEIAGEDHRFMPASASIDGETLVVRSASVEQPVAARYCWGAADGGTLWNGAGLPASSFRTDDWPSLTERAEYGHAMHFDRRGNELVLAAPIERWDEAIPLGNGLIGGLLWGSGHTIRLSLDRGDLWDERIPPTLARSDWSYETMKELVAARDHEKLVEMFDTPYDASPYPTKIPAGRLEIELDPALSAESFRLDLATADGAVDFGSDRLTTCFSGLGHVALLLAPGNDVKVRLVRPVSLDKLGYEPAEAGADAGSVWFVQKTAEHSAYAILARSRPEGRMTRIGVAIAEGSPDFVLLDVSREVDKALEKSRGPVLGEHDWWQRFTLTSSVHVPDVDLQAQYDLARYFYGAASRADCPPIPLQGVWTADDGQLPPWKGDYHNDLNTETTYSAYPTAGLFSAGESFLRFHSRLSLEDGYESFAKRFFGVDGAVVPGVMTLHGHPMSGWGMYSLSPTNGAWVAQAFDLHWKYTCDPHFLADKAYPFSSKIATALLALSKPDAHGKLKLPLSSSPEIHDNSLAAWLTPNSNYDLALMRWLFGACGEMAETLGKKDESARWKDALAHLDDFDVEEGSPALTFARGEPYRESHRHLSHAMAIHPLGLLTIEGTPRERAIIEATLDRTLEMGSDSWCGYTFAWMACMLARCGRAELALDHLEAFQSAFLLRNGFHCNGDQSGMGLSHFTYRPFTLEGNFLGMQAVHEMLLQSWGGTVRVFPAVSARWRDVSFKGLWTEGAFQVSAERKDGRTLWVRVETEKGGELRLRDPFPEGAGHWSRDAIARDKRDILVKLPPGEAATGWVGEFSGR